MRSRTLLIAGAVAILAAIAIATIVAPRLGRAFEDMRHAESDGPGDDVSEHGNDVMLGDPAESAEHPDESSEPERVLPTTGAPVSQPCLRK